MFCENCGEKISAKVKFCPYCGEKIKRHSERKILQLTCKRCNGTMEVDANEKVISCPYCGLKIRILDSDAVAIEKIRKEVEIEKIKEEKRREAELEKQEEQQAYRKSKLSKFTVVFFVFCLLFLPKTFSKRNFLAMLICVIQLVSFAASWLMGRQIIKEKRKNIHVALATLGFILILPFISVFNQTEKDTLTWPTTGLAENIPNPEAEYGNIWSNTEKYLSIDIDSYSEEKSENYIEACKEYGFTIEPESSNSKYTAYNEDGYLLDIFYYSDSLDIKLTAPRDKEAYVWPTTKLAEQIPQPKSTMGEFDYETDDYFVLYVGQTSLADYKEYVKQVYDAGFTVDYDKRDKYFYGKNKDGYSVTIEYEGYNNMRIKISDPD